MKEYNYLIVGAGLYGATFAYKAHKAGKRCLVIDRRSDAGGNVHCENIEGINVHKYGAHIFHTSDKEVWGFMNSLVPFNRYTNAPIANYKGQLYNLPFNMNTFNKLWGVTTPEEAEKVIEEQRAEALSKMKDEGVSEPRNLEEQALCLAGKDIYEKLIKGYTEKQWGRKCHELPAFIIRRLPFRLVYDNNYFNDTFQGIPEGGYNKLIDVLLKGIEVKLGVDFFDDRNYWESIAEKIVYCGEIDKFFDYRLGRLEYRSLRFETETLPMSNRQGVAVMNYTDAETPYTRIIEHKHFECFGNDVYRNPVTVITREYSAEWKPGLEPYYPVNDERNSKLYESYAVLAKDIPNILFAGRLAEYRYYDMAPIVAKALKEEF